MIIDIVIITSTSFSSSVVVHVMNSADLSVVVALNDFRNQLKIKSTLIYVYFVNPNGMGFVSK